MEKSGYDCAFSFAESLTMSAFRLSRLALVSGKEIRYKEIVVWEDYGMMTRSSIVLFFFALFWQVQAESQTIARSFSINAYGVEGVNTTSGFGYDATNGAQGAIVMPEPVAWGTSQFHFSLTVPEDYSVGTSMFLHVGWRSHGVSCVVDLRNNALYRTRLDTATDAGVLVNDEPLVAPSSNTITGETAYELAGLELQPGDVVQGGLFRSSGEDSCAGDFHVLGLSVSYRAVAN